LDFFSSSGNLGLDQGGVISMLTGGQQIYKISTNQSYGIETGSITPAPEPATSSLAAISLIGLAFFARAKLWAGSHSRG
jgi:hypothetical protein